MDLQHYKSFDPIFFREEERATCAEEYRTALESPDEHSDTLLRLSRWEERLHPLMIPKPYLMSISVDDLATRAGVTLSETQETYCCNRNKAHLTRLLMPQEYYVCGGDMYYADAFTYDLGAHIGASQAFALEFIWHVSCLQEIRAPWKPTRGDEFLRMAGAESEAVYAFWTLAPHAHAELKANGLSPDESIERIIGWACDAEEDLRYHTHYLAGHPLVHSHLGFDERMPSHLLARREAVRILPHIRR